jgi:hypothetical protein
VVKLELWSLRAAECFLITNTVSRINQFSYYGIVSIDIGTLSLKFSDLGILLKELPADLPFALPKENLGFLFGHCVSS